MSVHSLKLFFVLFPKGQKIEAGLPGLLGLLGRSEHSAHVTSSFPPLSPETTWILMWTVFDIKSKSKRLDLADDIFLAIDSPLNSDLNKKQQPELIYTIMKLHVDLRPKQLFQGPQPWSKAHIFHLPNDSNVLL